VSVAVAVAVLGALPVSVEVVKGRLVAPPEILRKTVHIGAALLVAPLPLFLSYREIAAIGLLFAAVMALSRRRGLFSAVHDAERTSYGEILFPLGVAALALLFPSPAPFVYGVLVVGLADGAAALVGMRVGRRRLPGGKSVWGSAVFLGISTAVGLGVLLAGGTPLGAGLTTAAFAAIALTVAEALLHRGLDNLVLPPLAGFAIGIRVEPLLVAEALYLIAPAVLAGIAHAVVIKRDLFSRLRRPIDGGRSLRGRRLFGANKTWRGLAVMVTACTFGVLAQTALTGFEPFRSLSAVNYRIDLALALGLALGLGYSLAELPNSFVKRQLGIRPGELSPRGRPIQYLADQADSVAGCVLALVVFGLGPALLALVFACGLALHMVFDRLLYAFGVKTAEATP
jgi:dolichol kinase